MSYQDTLKQLQENLHIERQLETFPQWVTMVFIIAIGFIIIPFTYQTLRRSISVYEIETNNPTFHSIMNGALILGVISTCIIGIIALGYYRPYISLTNESKQHITTYLSQLDTDEYAKLKQQVEVNRNTSFDDKTAQSIHEQLTSTLSPENKRTFFFFFRH